MRIFVTVGAQMPFDRLIAAMDAWASSHREVEVVAQIGESTRAPSHLAWSQFLSPAEFERAYDAADAIVGHAGIGTLFAALERKKPIVVMPRRAALRETRNDHQRATAERFAELAGVSVAWDESELPARLATLDRAVPSRALHHETRGPLIRTIAELIGGPKPPKNIDREMETITPTASLARP